MTNAQAKLHRNSMTAIRNVIRMNSMSHNKYRKTRIFSRKYYMMKPQFYCVHSNMFYIRLWR